MKREVKEKVDAETARKLEEQNYEALRYSMSKHFLMAVIGKLMEEILERKISTLYSLRVTDEVAAPLELVTAAWSDVLRAVLPLITREMNQLGPAYDVTRDVAQIDRVAERVGPLIEVARESHRKAINRLRQRILPS